MRNSEGYYDPTAGIAIRNVERNERMMQEFKRGDIFYVEKSGSRAASGSNQPEGRPALIVSNDRFNKTSDILEVVYLTYNPRNDLPTHVTIRQTTSESVAICEQVTSVHKERFISYISSATEDEMARIDMALLISLDLNMGVSQAASTASQAAPEPIPIPSPQPVAPPRHAPELGGGVQVREGAVRNGDRQSEVGAHQGTFGGRHLQGALHRHDGPSHGEGRQCVA